MELRISPDISLLCGTPVLVRRVSGSETIIPALVAAVRERMRGDPGVNKSNRGGWQSGPDLWEWPCEAFDVYRGWVHDAVLRMAALSPRESDLAKVEISYEAVAWANVNRNGDYNDRR